MKKDKMNKFEVGKQINIEDLTENQAIAIFGEPVYRAWKEGLTSKTSSQNKTIGTVTDVDQKNKTVTVKFEPTIP
jgi:hypothetical protein